MVAGYVQLDERFLVPMRELVNPRVIGAWRERYIDLASAEVVREAADQRRLADADRALDGDVLGLHRQGISREE